MAPKIDLTKSCPHCNGKGRVADPIKVGEFYRQRRIKAGLTLRQVARVMGVSAPFLVDMELGRRNLNPQRLTQYEKILQNAK